MCDAVPFPKKRKMRRIPQVPFLRMMTIFFHVIFILVLQPSCWWRVPACSNQSNMFLPVHVLWIMSHPIFCVRKDQPEPCCHKGWCEIRPPVNYQNINFEISLFILHVIFDIRTLIHVESLSYPRENNHMGDTCINHYLW